MIKPKHMNSERWFELTFFEQMANIGSEVERTIAWKEKNNPQYSKMAFERSLELLDLTISDPRNKSRLKELLRVRETLADYFEFDNIYKSSDKLWRGYFFPFNWAARLNC